jgi:hypothetical protein
MAWYAYIQPFYRSHAYLQVQLELDIDPVAAKTPFFAPENATKWVVLEQWHIYWMKRRQEQRHTLSQSAATSNGPPNHVTAPPVANR